MLLAALAAAWHLAYRPRHPLYFCPACGRGGGERPRLCARDQLAAGLGTVAQGIATLACMVAA